MDNHTQSPRWFTTLCFVASALALFVVMLGAFTRLTDAGLGCPDWPGCYGQMVVAPDTPLASKAWTEMIHRYIAGTLGLLILAIAFCAFKLKAFRLHASLIVLLVVFQALLGMWTVTLLLHPMVVMGHLMGGMTITALLWLLTCRTQTVMPSLHRTRALTFALLLALLLVFLQIALGGWTSSNYAAMACTDFPTCREVWWPQLHLREAFNLFPPLDKSYEGGPIAHPVKVTIHFMHRLGALIVFAYLSTLTLYIAARIRLLRKVALVTLGILLLQVSLGISNILLLLPLPIAVAHNGVGALLLLAVITLNQRYFAHTTKGHRL